MTFQEVLLQSVYLPNIADCHVSLLSRTDMKKPIKITHTNFTMDTDDFDHFMVINFIEANQVKSTHIVRYPEWWRYWDKRYRYYIPSNN